MNTQHDWKEVTLPSRGAYYDGAVPEGKVRVRAWTGGELARLNQGGNILDRIESTLAVTAKLPDSISLLNLLAADRMYLLLAVRTVTFGPHYTFEWRCGCGKKNLHQVDISTDLAEKNVPGETKNRELTEPVEITLSTGQVCEFKFIRGKDERSLQQHEKRQQHSGGIGQEPTEMYRLQLQLATLDGAVPHIVDKKNFVDNLSANDLVLIEQTLEENEPGIDLTVFPDCSSCGAPEEVDLPFDMEFFRPKRRPAK